ncbi:MAG: hypothetical protein FJ255_13100 [Phycisphaerae bacterium]|nr:hypothetical protein [Phycisphaerae bacterium]
MEPLHAPSLVFETGDAEPTPASSPVPTPTRFEARALRYRFLAIDPDDPARVSPVKEWSPKLRLKYQLLDRGDHHEIELLALPKANGVEIRYTTDGSAPTGAAAATYDGVFRVPGDCRVVCAMAVCAAYSLTSGILRIQIPQTGTGPQIDPGRPACWTQQTKLDDAGAVWDFLRRLEATAGVFAHDISLTAESADGRQNVDYSGSLEGGYDGAAARQLAEQLQGIVSAGGLRMVVGSLAFPSGQALLDWLRDTRQTFNLAKVRQ